MSRFVVSGTDTGVGKTVFSAALTSAIGAHYWKPIQSGLEGETDSQAVARMGALPSDRILPEGYILREPVSPHFSARLDGVEIDTDGLALPDVSAPLVIEGAGGLLVPLSENAVFADIFARWMVPVIICARTTLGTINHTLLSIEALRGRNIPLFGLAFIGDENVETQRIIVEMSGSRCLGRLPFLESLTPATLAEAFRNNFDPSVFGGWIDE